MFDPSVSPKHLFIAVSLHVLFLLVGGSAQAQEFITNGAFSSSFNGCGNGDLCPDAWTLLETTPSETSMVQDNSEDGPSHTGGTSNSWDFDRSSGGMTGDLSAIVQKLSIFAPGFASLTLSLDAKVISHNLVAGGTVDPAFEWPAFVQIDYKDLSDNSQIWRYGWYLASPGDGPRTDDPGQGAHSFYNDEQIADSTWVARSFNLKTELPTAKEITRIIVGGSGWDFHSRMDNISIVGGTPIACVGPKPKINVIEPCEACSGENVTIKGENFGGPSCDVDVTWNNSQTAKNEMSVTSTEIVARIPFLAGCGADKPVHVIVNAGGFANKSKRFSYTIVCRDADLLCPTECLEASGTSVALTTLPSTLTLTIDAGSTSRITAPTFLSGLILGNETTTVDVSGTLVFDFAATGDPDVVDVTLSDLSGLLHTQISFNGHDVDILSMSVLDQDFKLDFTESGVTDRNLTGTYLVQIDTLIDSLVPVTLYEVGAVSATFTSGTGNWPVIQMRGGVCIDSECNSLGVPVLDWPASTLMIIVLGAGSFIWLRRHRTLQNT